MAPGTRIERIVRSATRALAALLFALPVLLGPAMPTVVSILADVVTEHHCACGMKAGRCGCPECEDAERRLDRPSGPVVQRFSCDDPRFLQGALPPMLLPARMTAPAAPVRRDVRAVHVDLVPESRALEPPTPPPRARA